MAREAAADTLSDVRKAMKINYFDDDELIAEQSKNSDKNSPIIYYIITSKKLQPSKVFISNFRGLFMPSN